MIPSISNNLTESLELDKYQEYDIVAIIDNITRTLIDTISSAKEKAFLFNIFILII